MPISMRISHIHECTQQYRNVKYVLRGVNVEQKQAMHFENMKTIACIFMADPVLHKTLYHAIGRIARRETTEPKH